MLTESGFDDLYAEVAEVETNDLERMFAEWNTGIGEKHVCPQCWDDGRYADQQQLTDCATAAEDQIYAIVGCGKEK